MNSQDFSVEHSKILGFFNFQDIYTEQVSNVSDDDNTYQTAHFVEVGALFGRSTAFMAFLIQQSGKNIRFDVVDVWDVRGAPELDVDGHHWVEGIGGYQFKKDGPDIMYRVFLRNMKACGVLDYIRPLKLPSVFASEFYDDDTLDFIFLDADHSTESVTDDINAWFPKLAPGCIFAGHDYDWPSVREAVDDLFPTGVVQRGTSWMVLKG